MQQMLITTKTLAVLHKIHLPGSYSNMALVFSTKSQKEEDQIKLSHKCVKEDQ